MTAILRLYHQVAVVPTRSTRRQLNLIMRYPKPLWYYLLRFAFRNSQK
ncbi:MAG: hypothetical protein RLZZ103_582 [Pseudomonadota bacterium]